MTVPCGTSDITVADDDMLPSTNTCWDLPPRKTATVQPQLAHQPAVGDLVKRFCEIKYPHVNLGPGTVITGARSCKVSNS